MTYYLGLRMDEKEDAALIKDIDRFLNNKKFTRSHRVRELMRLGQMVEARNISISTTTGRAMVEAREAMQEAPRALPVKSTSAKLVAPARPHLSSQVAKPKPDEPPKKKGLFERLF